MNEVCPFPLIFRNDWNVAIQGRGFRGCWVLGVLLFSLSTTVLMSPAFCHLLLSDIPLTRVWQGVTRGSMPDLTQTSWELATWRKTSSLSPPFSSLPPSSSPSPPLYSSLSPSVPPLPFYFLLFGIISFRPGIWQQLMERVKSVSLSREQPFAYQFCSHSQVLAKLGHPDLFKKQCI